MAVRGCSFLFALILILVSSPVLQVVRCQSDEDVAAPNDVALGPAPGVDTVCLFSKNAAKLVLAGEETELLVGLHNEGESALQVISIHASLHLPFNHHIPLQNRTLQNFYNASVPVAAQATFPFTVAVSKYLQPGSFDLVGTIVYEIEQQPYQSVFYNGTIEVAEAGGFLTIKSVFAVTLGLGLSGLFGLWMYNQNQQSSKKAKISPMVEVGTRTTEADIDEWLQGTAYAKSLSTKSKSKKKKK